MKGYYINLEKRSDRNDYMKEYILNRPFFENIERFNAITHKKGAVGCTLSHINCLKKLQENSDPYYMILEDDFLILNEENYKLFIDEFEKIKQEKWDIMILTPRGKIHTNNITNGFHRIIDNQTTTGYIIKHDFIKILLPIFENSVKYLEEGGNPDLWALDSCWKPLQNSTHFWYFEKIYAGQLPGYSDIEKRNVNYNQRFVMQNTF
tara:strand:- start:834 stop:1454 length:621 start_codon:yes stop_codon:yes gene_type:complete